MVYDFSSKNFKEFCEINDLDSSTARRVVMDEVCRLLDELEMLSGTTDFKMLKDARDELNRFLPEHNEEGK